MSINGASLAADGSLTLNPGERLVFSQSNVKLTLEKKGKDFKDVAGTAYLTDQRIVFKADKPKNFTTIDMPKQCLTELDVKQPLFGANAFVGKCDAMPDGGFEGTAEFKMSFQSGGAIEFAKLCSMAFSGRLPSPQPMGMPPMSHPQYGYGMPPPGYPGGQQMPPPGYPAPAPGGPPMGYPAPEGSGSYPPQPPPAYGPPPGYAPPPQPYPGYGPPPAMPGAPGSPQPGYYPPYPAPPGQAPPLSPNQQPSAPPGYPPMSSADSKAHEAGYR